MSSAKEDIIPPREGEEVDLAKIRTYLSGKIPGSEKELHVKQFSGGHANLTYLLQYGKLNSDNQAEFEYVLRRPPHGHIAPHAHDMRREYRVLSVLYKAFPYAPKALLFCDDKEILGAPFFVMEKKQGTVVRKKVPAHFGSGKNEIINRQLSVVLIESLAAFHNVDYEKIGLGDLGKAANFMKRQIRGWGGGWHNVKTDEVEDAVFVIQWLKDHLPQIENGSLVHNDWRLDNIMLDSKDPSKLVSVFDWDMCTIGEPLADLGTLLSLWFEPGEQLDLTSNPNDDSLENLLPSKIPGFMTRKEAVELYGKKSGFDVSEIDYFMVFGMFKMAVIGQQIFRRFHDGDSHDERFREFDKAVKLILARARKVAEAMK